MVYQDGAQVKIELKKMMLESGVKQTEIAQKMGIMPQSLQNILNKKKISFSDAARMADAAGYQLEYTFEPKK